MKYLIVSCTLFDGGGLAMIRGAVNGISELDEQAEFRSLHAPVHHKEGIMESFIEHHQNDEAFEWADVILDVGGLCNGQDNKWTWMRLRNEYQKPYVWMSQSFKKVEPRWLEGTEIIARGVRSAQVIREMGYQAHVAADLSFLVKPVPWQGKKYHRVFITHIAGKIIDGMYQQCDKETDVQIITKPYREKVWEPELPIKKLQLQVEEYFGLIASTDEIHSARYQCVCAAILAGKPFTVYDTEDLEYNEKYLDLMDFTPMNREALRESAMISCHIAVAAARGEKWNRDQK